MAKLTKHEALVLGAASLMALAEFTEEQGRTWISTQEIKDLANMQLSFLHKQEDKDGES